MSERPNHNSETILNKIFSYETHIGREYEAFEITSQLDHLNRIILLLKYLILTLATNTIYNQSLNKLIMLQHIELFYIKFKVNDDSYLIRLLPQLNEFIRMEELMLLLNDWARVNNWHLRTEGKLVRIGVITIFILILTIQGYQLFLYSAESLPATTRQGALSSMMTSSASSPYDPANLDGQSANTSNERDPILDNNSIMGNNSGIEGSFLLNHKVEELLAESSEYIGAFQPTDLMVESNQIVTEETPVILFPLTKYLRNSLSVKELINFLYGITIRTLLQIIHIALFRLHNILYNGLNAGFQVFSVSFMIHLRSVTPERNRSLQEQ
ncbi:hypothetical protein GLOIN_2v741538 [Rhizophagus irregularis DAOM 181602=DAOM 197198]|nr:hypothetical protein GLOIN_2v741538 [Rhizophagus irregularis DAOM 181602=DAOM 197198]